MKVFIAYAIVIVLVQFCLTFGCLIAGFPIALCLAWASGRLRAIVAGTLAGVVGIAAAVGFGYLIFHLLLGPNSYNIAAFIASTVPLVIPIVNDRKRAHDLTIAESNLPEGAKATASPITASAKYSVVGYQLGLVLATVWFFIIR